jgi:hypothetical protein
MATHLNTTLAINQSDLGPLATRKTLECSERAAPAPPSPQNGLIKLISHRPTFAQDLTEEESNTMKQHAAYWKDKADKGIAFVYGPVRDPKGAYGLGIVEVENED